MNLDKFTQKSQEAVFDAQHLARELNHQAIEPTHLLMALLRQEEGVVPAIVTRVAGSVQGLREELRQDLDNRPRVYGGNGDVGLARPAADVLEAAERYARGMQDDYVSTEHILLGLTESVEGKRLSQYGLTKDAILKALASVRGTQRVTSQTPETTYQALEKYGRDMTSLARQGKMDPVIGRDEEIRRVVQILSRRTKNNPALIGDPGVGKTAIVEVVDTVDPAGPPPMTTTSGLAALISETLRQNPARLRQGFGAAAGTLRAGGTCIRTLNPEPSTLHPEPQRQVPTYIESPDAPRGRSSAATYRF